MSKTNVTPQDAPDLASDAELAAHAADTTSVHGIADTSVLSTTSHVHAGADITSGTVADARIASTLARDSEVSGAITTHEAAGDPHPGYLTTAEGGAAYEPVGTVATHEADSTSVHGITDTSALVVDGDAAGGELAGTYPNPTVAASHSGSTHAATQAAAEATAAGALTTHEGAADPHTGYLTTAEGNAAYQPVDSDLTAIAALTTTVFGRGLLALADAAALAANHSHDPIINSYAPGSFTVPDGDYTVMTKRLQLTTTQRVTLAGTARVRIT